MHRLYLEVSHVLDFFAVVEALLEDAAVDEKMLRQGLIFYYHWWRDEVMDPLRNLLREIQKPTADPKCVPPWAKPMRQLDRLVLEKTAELAKEGLAAQRKSG
jgi:hypothetical protein